MWMGCISVQVFNIYLHFVIVRESACHPVGMLKSPFTLLACFAEYTFGETEGNTVILSCRSTFERSYTASLTYWPIWTWTGQRMLQSTRVLENHNPICFFAFKDTLILVYLIVLVLQEHLLHMLMRHMTHSGKLWLMECVTQRSRLKERIEILIGK